MKFDLGHIRKITVIHVVLTETIPVFHYLILKLAKDEIEFVKRGENFRDLAVLLKKTTTQFPILLHFSGKGILNRKAVYQENYHHSILLNAAIDAFYFSDYHEDKFVFSSVIRKDVVDEMVNNFTTKKGIVISISSGPFHSALLNQVLLKETFVVDAIRLHFEDNKLHEFDKVASDDRQISESLLLGTERLNANFLPCAAAGAAFFKPNEKVIFPNNDSIFNLAKEEAKQKNSFMRFGMGMLFFFLLILFGNHLYVGHLNQMMTDNTVFLFEYDDQLAEIADLEEEKVRKESLLQSSGLLNKRFLSFYLMELANSVPSSITFDEVVVRPLTDEIKQRQKIAFEEHLVWINGRAESSHVLSRWIEVLEEKEWLSKVDILSYEYIKNEGVFELELVVI